MSSSANPPKRRFGQNPSNPNAIGKRSTTMFSSIAMLRCSAYHCGLCYSISYLIPLFQYGQVLKHEPKLSNLTNNQRTFVERRSANFWERLSSICICNLRPCLLTGFVFTLSIYPKRNFVQTGNQLLRNVCQASVLQSVSLSFDRLSVQSLHQS